MSDSLEQSVIDHLGDDDGGDGLGAAEDIDERIRAERLVDDFRRRRPQIDDAFLAGVNAELSASVASRPHHRLERVAHGFEPRRDTAFYQTHVCQRNGKIEKEYDENPSALRI